MMVFVCCRKHDVDKVFKLDSNAPQNSINSQRLYMIMSDLISAKRVCDQVNAEQRKDVDYHVILVPRGYVVSYFIHFTP